MRNLFLSVFVFFFSSNLFPQFSGGTGTPADPYKVATPADLNNVRNYLSSCFIQTADIDLTTATAPGGIYYYGGAGWEPIGPVDYSAYFRGIYDGGFHKIIGLKCYRPKSSALFAGAYGAEIKNLFILNGEISITDQITGALCGFTTDCLIENIHSNMNIICTFTVGGIIGYSWKTQIKNCSFSGNIQNSRTDDAYIGGITGYAHISSIENCSFSGNINIVAGPLSASIIGGIAGIIYRDDLTGTANVVNCYSTGTINNGINIGGIIGGIYYSGGTAPISNCYFAGVINSTSRGPVIGIAYTPASVSNTYYKSNTPDGSYGTNKTEAELKLISTYTGWNFDTVWGISPNVNNGYPYLRKELCNKTFKVTDIGADGVIRKENNIGFKSLPGQTVSLICIEASVPPPDVLPGARSIGKYWEVDSITGGSVKLRLYYTALQKSGFTGVPKVYEKDTAGWHKLSTDAEQVDRAGYYVESSDPHNTKSLVTVGDDNTIFPVELNSFTAEFTGTGTILNWQTASEINSSGFDVERSISFDNSTWQSIGFVKALGNSNKMNSYSFTDKDVKTGFCYYRLKMTDNDGSFTYSKTVELVYCMPDEFSLLQNYPNPFNPETRIGYTVAAISKVHIAVYDVLGNKAASLVNEVKQPGCYNVTFNASDFPSGVYFCRMTAGNNTFTRKLLFIK